MSVINSTPVIQHHTIKASFNIDPIYNTIISCLSPTSQIRLHRACATTYGAVEEFSTRAFNINCHIGRFFKDPLGFRSLQARTGTLISGSNTLQFLDRSFYPESDMDLYINPGHCKEVGLWLMHREGYTLHTEGITAGASFEELVESDSLTEPDDETFMAEMYGTKLIGDIFTFHITTASGETLNVQVILTVISAFHAITDFHSSK